MLNFFTALVESPLGGLLTPSLMESAGLNWFRKQVVDEAPTPEPLHFAGAPATKDATVPEKEWPKLPAKQDAAAVARMRAAGALLVGKTNMHDIGINVMGLNPHHGTTRNPYNTGHYTGGSSSGSATAVAAEKEPVPWLEKLIRV